MAGNGIKEILSVIYAPTSVDKILTGHAYSRAVRGHMLVCLVLHKIILSEISISSEEHEILQNLIDLFVLNSCLENIDNNFVLENVNKKFQEKMLEIKNRGDTAKLWIQYVRMVSIANNFIRAEKMGDWNLHI